MENRIDNNMDNKMDNNMDNNMGNNMDGNMNNKMPPAELLTRLQAVSFAMMDMQLYLDTHPFDQDALRVYKSYLPMYRELKTRYEQQVGPLHPQDAVTETDWRWVDGPWPWEASANGRS